MREVPARRPQSGSAHHDQARLFPVALQQQTRSPERCHATKHPQECAGASLPQSACCPCRECALRHQFFQALSCSSQSLESDSLTLKDAEMFFSDAVSIFGETHNRITTLSQDEETLCILFLWNLNVDHLKPLPEHPA